MSQAFTYRHQGLKYSGIFHLALILIAIIGLPSWFNRQRDLEPQVMTVDILPLAPMTNVKPMEPAPQPKKEEPKKAETPKPVPETAKEQAKPKEEPVPSPDATKKVVKKEEKKTQQDDLERILKSVKETAKTEEGKKPKEAKSAAQTPAKSERYDPAVPLSVSEKDMIRNQFVKCWNVPAGAKNAENLVVVLRVMLLEDGSLASAALARDEGRYNSDPFFRAAVDSAIRAVHLCSPLQNLPADKFSAWRDMELTFDPKEML